jgi:hypothetical protein
MVTRTSARLCIYRDDGDQGAVLAWEILKCRDAGTKIAPKGRPLAPH